MVPPITPLLSKQIPSASSTSSADASITEATPISKKRYRDAVKRALFTFRPSKKPKSISLSHVQTENESEKMVATKSMEEIVSDSDLPIIGLKKKSSMESLATTSVIEASAELVEDALGICFERSGVMGGTIWVPMFSVSCAAKLLSDDCDVGSRSGIVSSKIA
ncbi:hypothetical protein L3X38_044648 [Prunus dulcis]|uniref:Uncharacterized protein n=1 Tax=Prunus dulcis TaxID=3755 RepID=A0AAD4YMD9_PRUDU|nr:hypothetical protein L3X38_044648 [Prunus dulcis]